MCQTFAKIFISTYTDFTMTNAQRVYEIVSQIPKGQVTTYGLIAKLADIKSPRAVGTMLHKNVDPDLVPCHRVVNQKGMLSKHYAFGGAYIQREKLEKEDVRFINNKINLKDHLWDGR